MTDIRDYYETHAQSYYENTFGLNPSVFLEPFIRVLSPGASILDIGCGSGRDIRWLRQRGFSVTGLERSPALAKLARSRSRCGVMEGDFETFDFSSGGAWDAFMMVGALVHIPHERLFPVLRRIIEGRRSFRTALITLKEGDGVVDAVDGRRFYLWRDEAVRDIYAQLEVTVASFFRNLSATGSGESWLGYVVIK